MGDGLVSDNIHSICQDSLGYIWIGTGEGLSRFDSKEFYNYSKAEGLTSDKIFKVVADRQNPGVVWIGTEGGGMEKYVNGKFKNYTTSLPPPMKVIDALYLDEKNILWCGTDSGLFKIEKDSIHIFQNTFKLGNIYCLTSDANGSIWIGSENGLFKFSIRMLLLTRVKLKKHTNQKISLLFRSKRGEIWAATFDGYLFKIYPHFNYSQFVNLNTSIYCIKEDDNGNMWIATSSGIFKFKENAFPPRLPENLTMENGLLENNVTSLFFDRENVLWVGTNDNGIQKLVHQNLIRFKIPKKYITENWSSTSVDTNNHFWLSFAKGLMEIWSDKLGKWHYYFHSLKPNTSSDFLPSIYLSRSNIIYMGYGNGSIKIYKIINKVPASPSPSYLELKEHFNLGDKLKFYSIYTIYCDRRKFIWCSALDLGVVVIGPTKQRKIVKIYRDRDGLPDNSVRKIFEDSKGNFWFGGYAHGLAEFSLGKVLTDLHLKLNRHAIFKRLYTTLNGLPDNGIRSMSDDDNGNLLIGTRYGGLAVLSGSKFRSITREQGLFSNAIWSIAKTPGNEFWLGTQSGVQKINKNLKPELKLGGEIPKVPYYSICCSNKNVLCFINNTDIYLYEPMLEKGKILPPPVYLSRLFINGQVERISSNLSLPSFKNTITFQFIGIVNRSENLTKYFYRLRNVDDNWNLLVNRNSVTYASLRPGNYKFQVYAVDNNNIKSIHPAELSFTIEEPFYEQWWFISVILSIIILSIVIAARARVKSLLAIEKIRMRIAADLHDEIGSGLTRIAILSENALSEEKTDENLPEDISGKYSRNKSIERVGKISRSLVDSMMDVIWSIDPKYDSLEDFIFNFRTYANEVCEAKNIKLLIKTKNVDNVKVNSQIKRNLQLVSKEALNNALKYSGCTFINYSLEVKGKEIILLIEDNGTGFDIGTIKLGHGIFNMEKHAKDLSGAFICEPLSGSGTKVGMRFPLRK